MGNRVIVYIVYSLLYLPRLLSVFSVDKIDLPSCVQNFQYEKRVYRVGTGDPESEEEGYHWRRYEEREALTISYEWIIYFSAAAMCSGEK